MNEPATKANWITDKDVGWYVIVQFTGQKPQHIKCDTGLS